MKLFLCLNEACIHRDDRMGQYERHNQLKKYFDVCSRK